MMNPIALKQPAREPGGVLPLISGALSFASLKHMNQRRRDVARSPYIKHPIDVFNVLAQEAAIEDPVVLCAALLHDTVEDTDTSEDELRNIFGTAIAGVVMEVTDDKTIAGKGERKQRRLDLVPFMSREARLVKLADLISNLRDHNGSGNPGWPPARRRDYFEWAARIGERCSTTSPLLWALLKAEIEAGSVSQPD